MGTITLHCGQYTTVFEIIDGRMDSKKTYKNGKKYNSFLVPEPVSRLIYAHYLKYAEAFTPSSSASIEHVITSNLTADELRQGGW